MHWVTNKMKTKYFFKLIDAPSCTDELAFCVAVDPLLFFHYPLKSLSNLAKKQLKDKVILTEAQNLLRINLLKELPICERFIHSIIAMHIIENDISDYRDEKVKQLKKFNNMPLREFVSAPGYHNLFFVVDVDMTDLSLICVEVHPNKPIVYRRVILCVKQVSLANWRGPIFPLENFEEVFSITDDHALYQKIKEIENRERKPESDE
jgi:hypothetical protein